MASNINITINGTRLRRRAGITAGAACALVADATGKCASEPLIACLVNNEVCSLSFPLTVNCHLQRLTMCDPLGMRVYRDSLVFLLTKTVSEMFPQYRMTVEHSLGTGFYCGFDQPAELPPLTADMVKRLEAAMRREVRQNLPFTRRRIAFEDALAELKRTNRHDIAGLLRFRNPPLVVLHACGKFADLAHSPLAPATGVLTKFKLIHYPPGIVLQFPDRAHPKRLAPFHDQPHLFRIFHDHKHWGRTVGVSNVARLNELIYQGRLAEFIRMSEAFHEKKISHIADQIASRQRSLKIILISGPSAAGKTTLAKRLTTQLHINGIPTTTISLDNYYVNDADTPRDETGQPDYEHINAIDIPLFNHHLAQLVKGHSVELPYFNFETKRREFRGNHLQLDKEQMLIVEGIHGLNPNLTPSISACRKFKIYVNALTQLNIDANNRISTTDNRLIRRMVRDYQFRSNSALATLNMWPSVRRGEKTWIFPFHAEVDAAFNSALDYELAILKPLVTPLLMTIKPSHSEYAETRRLQGFLGNFLDAPYHDVPATSILREYIGASSFDYQ